ncbi:peptidylprolyl isomerase [Thiotrichales bacterium HSG1]|nr:peptidylprolyl isomerase [Thiotrichales bacterium HSG1]
MKKYFIIFFLLTISAYAAEVPRVSLHTNFGLIVLELNPNKAPKTVENFLKYANDNFYDDTIFHRVIKNYIIQGGIYTKNYKKKTPLYEPIVNESDNGLDNLYGTIAMARNYREPDSATSQFFINVKDNPSLNYNGILEEMGYTVFGKVIEGMDIIDEIQSLKTGSKNQLKKYVPQNQVIIEVVVVKNTVSTTESPNEALSNSKTSLEDLEEKDVEEPPDKSLPNSEISLESLDEKVDDVGEAVIGDEEPTNEALSTSETSFEGSKKKFDDAVEETAEMIDTDVMDDIQSNTENIANNEDTVELATVVEPDIPPPKADLVTFNAQFPTIKFTTKKIPIDKIPTIQEKPSKSSKIIKATDIPSKPDTPDPFPY